MQCDEWFANSLHFQEEFIELILEDILLPKERGCLFLELMRVMEEVKECCEIRSVKEVDARNRFQFLDLGVDEIVSGHQRTVEER
jgi:hypothetical protein